MSDILPAPFEWCAIPSGKVTLSDDTLYDGTVGGIFEVPAFSIATYPVTNAQFQVFIAQGYADPQWWAYSAHAIAWRNEHPQPPIISDRRDHPCVNLSWYEAVAFCRWLNGRLRLGDSAAQQVTLPTEQQWQRAAQGDDHRVFPWGDTFDAALCNTLASAIGQTSSVIEYPLGASPFGVMDMSGNVWEWCLTQWGSERLDLESDALRGGRGGAYALVQEDARVGFRCGVPPFLRIAHVGFRLAGAAPI